MTYAFKINTQRTRSKQCILQGIKNVEGGRNYYEMNIVSLFVCLMSYDEAKHCCSSVISIAVVLDFSLSKG